MPVIGDMSRNWTMRIASAVLLVSLPFAPSQAGEADRPRRIVSMNLCADQLLLGLGVRDRLASVSFMARNPEDSLVADLSEGLNRNHGSLEEVLTLDPDLVLAGIDNPTSITDRLEDRGIEVVRLPMANSLDGLRRNIRTVAEAIGEPERGEAMIGKLDARLGAIEERLPDGPGPSVLIYGVGGYTLGPKTFPGALMAHAGFRNRAADYGIEDWGTIPVETVLRLDPDYLVIMTYSDDAPSRAQQMTDHPALHKYIRTVVEVPTRYWNCGTVAGLDALERIVDLRLAERRTARARAGEGAQ